MYQSFKFLESKEVNNLYRYYFRIENALGEMKYFFTYSDLSGIGLGKSDTVESAEDLILIGTVFLIEKENIRKAIKECTKMRNIIS